MNGENYATYGKFDTITFIWGRVFNKNISTIYTYATRPPLILIRTD